jgi:hypothetical protein
MMFLSVQNADCRFRNIFQILEGLEDVTLSSTESSSVLRSSQQIETGRSLDRYFDLVLNAAARTANAAPPYHAKNFVGHWRPPVAGSVPLDRGLVYTASPFMSVEPLVRSAIKTGGPPAYNSEEYGRAVNTVAARGRLDSAIRTPEQTAQARLWLDSDACGGVPLSELWMGVAEQACAQAALDARNCALLQMRVAVGVADAALAVWIVKQEFDSWRPKAALRSTALFNANVRIDSEWEPLLPEPPYQEYPSLDAAVGHAVAAVLEANGVGNTPVTVQCKASASAPVRHPSAAAAADAAAQAGLFAGLQFPFSIDDGAKLGTAIGRLAANATVASITTRLLQEGGNVGLAGAHAHAHQLLRRLASKTASEISAERGGTVLDKQFGSVLSASGLTAAVVISILGTFIVVAVVSRSRSLVRRA